MYGAQAPSPILFADISFENDVEMYGAQAGAFTFRQKRKFENDVEMYGAQAVTVIALPLC